jgi:hypothetical protein
MTFFMKVTEWDTYFPHFAPEEMLSPGGMQLFKKNIIPFDPVVLLKVEQLRADLNRAVQQSAIEAKEEIKIIINHGSDNLRGYVTPAEWIHKRHKKEGQSFSYHLWCAADISSPQVPPRTLFQFAKMIPFWGCIGYSWGVHVDMRRGEKYHESNL